MADIKLQALDSEDLAVISAQSQDAIVRVGDIAYLPGEHRFALVANRFDWMSATTAAKNRKNWQRRAAGMRFEGVKRAQITGFDPHAADAVLVLLSIEFAPAEAPSGWITLHFAAGAAIRLEVEYIEAELKDLGAVWSTANRPDHGNGEPASASVPQAAKPVKSSGG